MIIYGVFSENYMQPILQQAFFKKEDAERIVKEAAETSKQSAIDRAKRHNYEFIDRGEGYYGNCWLEEIEVL